MEPKEAKEEMNQLLVHLPQAKSATETFSLFAASVAKMFWGLKHISLLLLPRDSNSSDQATVTAAGSPGVQQKGASGKTASKASSAAGTAGNSAKQQHSAAVQHHTLDDKSELSSKLQAFRAGCSLDWSNCCVFNLYPGRGPVVQPHPSWPVACTATCYAAVTAGDVVLTGDYTSQGPHFLDWKSLAEQGCISMAAVPMFSCNRPVAVLCLASEQSGAFADADTLKLLGGILAPYCSMLEFTTRRMEMQHLVNEIITPIAAQLAQQKHSQLARLGCTVEEAPPGTVLPDGKGISVAIGSHNRTNSTSMPSSIQVAAAAAADAYAKGRRDAARLLNSVGLGQFGATGVAMQAPDQTGSNSSGVSSRRGKACFGKQDSVVNAVQGAGKCYNGGPNKALSECSEVLESLGVSMPGKGKHGTRQGITHKRFESVIVKNQPPDADKFGHPSDLDLDWSDFFFNLVSMAIVYVYFSKAAVVGESLIAILLCMGVAAFDIVLLVMRWLWFEQYINYGSFVLSVFQAYRVVVLPVANTWMSWSLLNKMNVSPSWPVISLLGFILLVCIVMGLQVRFFLHAPLQLASMLFAATSTPDLCGAFFDSTSSIRCIGIVSAVQLSLGLVLPSLMVYFLEGRSGRAFLPHMQAKRWLLHP